MITIIVTTSTNPILITSPKKNTASTSPRHYLLRADLLPPRRGFALPSPVVFSIAESAGASPFLRLDGFVDFEEAPSFLRLDGFVGSGSGEACGEATTGLRGPEKGSGPEADEGGVEERWLMD